MDYQRTRHRSDSTLKLQAVSQGLTELVGIYSQETMNDAAMWVKPHTAALFSNCGSGHREKNPARCHRR